MGMFDNILIPNELLRKCSIKCPSCSSLIQGDSPDGQWELFQTKDLESLMMNYTLVVTDKGWTLRHVDSQAGNDFIRFRPIHQYVQIYTSCKCNAPYPGSWIELELKFTDGILRHLFDLTGKKLIDQDGTPGGQTYHFPPCEDQ